MMSGQQQHEVSPQDGENANASVKSGGEDMVNHQLNDSGEKLSSPKQDQVSMKEIKEVLDKLKKEDVMPKEWFESADRLVKACNNRTPAEPNDLNQLFSLLWEQLLKQKSGQGGTNPEMSGGSSHKGPGYPVKVFTEVTGQTFGAHEVILEQVKKRISVEETNLQDCDIIIVFCPIRSRVGSDVEAAMRTVPGDKPILLVLMNHTRDVDFTTDRKRWSEKFPNIVLDVHVLYHESQQGLLKCARNDQAVQQIQLLHKHRHSKPTVRGSNKSRWWHLFSSNNQQQE